MTKELVDNASASAGTGADGTAVDLPPTEMIYYTYQGNFELECDSKILSCQFIHNNENKSNNQEEDTQLQQQEIHLCLDRTVLHAQGGGQPTDTGSIQIIGEGGGTSKKISITKVVLDRTTGVATHMGYTSSLSSKCSLIGCEKVRVTVDSTNRRILSECHTAGHVVDMAMAKWTMENNDSSKTLMPPTKAYHYLDGPYVEYKGNIPIEKRKEVLEKLQALFQELVKNDIATEIHNVSLLEAEKMCYEDNAFVKGEGNNYYRLREQFGTNATDATDDANDADNDDATMVRIVRVAGWPCACGGTHVNSTSDLKHNNWGITGFKCKKGRVRVKYNQYWNATK